jgi:DNA-directed RNA polymerase specialized sigma24 family protein
MVDYKSPAMRRAEVANRLHGGVRGISLLLYDSGKKYKEIALELCIPYGTFQKHMRRWRKDTKTP